MGDFPVVRRWQDCSVPEGTPWDAICSASGGASWATPYGPPPPARPSCALDFRPAQVGPGRRCAWRAIIKRVRPGSGSQGLARNTTQSNLGASRCAQGAQEALGRSRPGVGRNGRGGPRESRPVSTSRAGSTLDRARLGVGLDVVTVQEHEGCWGVCICGPGRVARKPSCFPLGGDELQASGLSLRDPERRVPPTVTRGGPRRAACILERGCPGAGPPCPLVPAG